MKKRILSILLSLCMVLCIAPVSVLADDTALQSVAIQSIGPNEAEVELDLYEKMSAQVSVIKLISDIELSGSLRVDYAVTIDLNGHVLKMGDIGDGSVIKIESTGDLTVIDSNPTAEHKFKVNDTDSWVLDETGGTKTVKGGVIYGGTGSKVSDYNGNSIAEENICGGGVLIESGGKLTMTGGNIVGCTATGKNAFGGGVFVSKNATFTMSGGSITGCTAVAQDKFGLAYGGGIHSAGSTDLSSTAVIRDCHAKGSYNLSGGGISDGLVDGKLYISGNVQIIGCTAGGYSSDAMYILDKANRNISGGTFYGSINAPKSKITGLTVTYQVNGVDYAKQVLRSGTAATKPNDPTNDGYVFVGWYNGDTPYDFTSPVTGDITLTAKWAKLVDKTADFTAPDDGAAAIALLNSTKNGAEDSTWDNGTKTLILKSVSMATTAATAVKLPDGATVILADGTENHIVGGGAAASENGKHENQIYVYGIYAAGALTIQGEANGTGTLFVSSGEHINSGNAWTYSVALYTGGDLAVKGGAVTAQGGKTSSADCAFSLGVQLSEGHGLSVSGGTLTAIGGESYDTGDPNDVDESFSEGIDIYRGNVTISGSGKLLAETVPNMMSKGLSFGLRTVLGSLFVSDSAALTAKTSQAIDISGGDIKLSGGKICSYATSDNAAISVTRSNFYNTGNGSIEITGGEIECVGGIYMSASPATEEMGILSVTGGNLTADSIYGPVKLAISDGTVTSGRINADTVSLQSGSLTIREPVYKNEYTNMFYASHAIYCKHLIVSGGTLDAAWDWGEYTPIVFPVDSYWGYAQPLVKTLNGTVSLSGGTVTLNTGCAGNTAIKTEKLNLSGGVRGSGYTNENGSDTYIQKDGGTPVKFVVYSADYTRVDAALNQVKTLDKDLYKDFSAVEAAVNAVVRGKNTDEQAAVDAMAQAIENAIAALQYKDADYSAVDAAVAKANALNKDEYKNFAAVESAINAVVRGKNITEQAAVDAMAQAIENAIAALQYKDADYRAVDAAITKANALKKDNYKDFSAVESAISAVVRGKNITEQASVDAMAKAIEDAIAALEYKGADYNKVDEAVAKANALNKDEYKDFSAVESAVNAVIPGKNITEQTAVDAMAKAIEDAIAALEYKDADYSKVDEAIKKANSMSKDEYKDFSAVQAAVNAVVRGKNITEQAAVDAMAKAIENAINALEKKPAEIKPDDPKSPQTGDNSNLMLWLALLFISGGICTVLTVKRKYRHGGNEK